MDPDIRMPSVMRKTTTSYLDFILQDEAHPHTDVSFSGYELWPLQAHGDIRETRLHECPACAPD